MDGFHVYINDFWVKYPYFWCVIENDQSEKFFPEDIHEDPR